MPPSSTLPQRALIWSAILFVPLFSLNAQNVRINEFSAHSMFIENEGGPPSDDWRAGGFVDSEWGKSVLPLGMDRSTEYDLPVNLSEQMYAKATSLYGRTKINVSAASANSDEDLSLLMGAIRRAMIREMALTGQKPSSWARPPCCLRRGPTPWPSKYSTVR